MPDLTPSEAATQLRHVAEQFCTPAVRQAALMGAAALEATRQPSIHCPVCGREINLAERDKA